MKSVQERGRREDYTYEDHETQKAAAAGWEGEEPRACQEIYTQGPSTAMGV